MPGLSLDLGLGLSPLPLPDVAEGGGGAPDNPLVLNGKYLKLNGNFLVLGA